MTVRIVCKNCGVKLDAPDKLIGQTRNCPKCKNPVLIVPETDVAPTPTPIVYDQAPADAEAEPDEAPLLVKRLHPDNLYVVLGSDKEIAYWKANEGWFLNLGSGYQLVKRAPDQIPNSGDFVLVEGYVEQTDAGKRLMGIRFKALTGRAVLNALIRSETEILDKAKFPTTLTQAQKRFLRDHIRKHYFYEFTDDAPEIMEYLGGFDAHSTQVGKFVDR